MRVRGADPSLAGLGGASVLAADAQRSAWLQMDLQNKALVLRQASAECRLLRRDGCQATCGIGSRRWARRLA